MKKLAILQSNYIPWKGYFDLIAGVDEFIIYDDVQYTKNDWRNRNQIKTKDGLKWLTIPVNMKKRITNAQKIRETSTQDTAFATKHWDLIQQAYRKAPYFNEISNWLEPLFKDLQTDNLSALNRIFIEAICRYLKIDTIISNSWDYTLEGDRTDRLVNLCQQASATVYVSGPAAKSYLDESLFTCRDMQVEWFSYEGYPEYPQLHGDFIHNVTILDVLFNAGEEASHYTWKWRDKHNSQL